MAAANDSLTNKKTLENHSVVRDTLKGTEESDSLIHSLNRNFFQLQPSPLNRTFNQDSLVRLSADSGIDNLAAHAIHLKDIAVGRLLKRSQPIYKKSHFSGHLLQPVHREPVMRVEKHQNWHSLLLLGILFSIAWARVLYPKRFTMLWNAFRLRRFASQLFREENVLTQRISILLFVVFLISGSYFFYFINETKSFLSPGGLLGHHFWWILIVFSGFILVKFIVHSIFGVVFKTQKEMAEYLFNMSLIQQIGGIGLFLLMVLQILGDRVPSQLILFSGAGIFLGIFIYQSYRGLVSALGSVSPVYFFLYFCALEILPVIWIYKLIIG